MGNKTLSNIDSVFNQQYKTLLDTQRSISKELENYDFNLEGNEITNAIFDRMMSFWHYHVQNCQDIGREINTVSADYFTETCLFFLKAIFKQHGLTVVSEKNIRIDKTTKVIRPDISIWKENKLIAVIELKVSDGWKGKTMVPHLDNRKIDIQNIWPNTFFGVISFWNCFGPGIHASDSEYIGLYDFAKDNDHKATGKTIEQLIKRILL